MIRYSSLLLLLPVLMTAAGGRDTHPPPPDLWTLGVSVEKPLLQPGRDTELQFSLRNQSGAAIHACIGTMQVSFKSETETPGVLSGNVSGGCCWPNHEFILPSRATLIWSETVKVPLGSSGKGSLWARLLICSAPNPATGVSEKVWQVSAETGDLRYSNE